MLPLFVKMKNFVICDLDGTLIDTIKGITLASNKMLKEFNYGYQYSAEDVTRFIGNGALKLFLRLIKEEEMSEKLNDAYNAFLKYYDEFNTSCEPYNNVYETLKRLNKLDIKIIIYSNKPDHLLQKLIKDKFSDIEFLYVQGKDENYPPKPDVTLLNMILEKFDLANINGLYVGDSYVDFLTSVNVKMDMCYCTYGYGKKEEESKIQAHFINDFSQILNYLK